MIGRIIRPWPPERVYTRMCRACGRNFETKMARQWHCSHRCQMRAWRAIKQLEGTHGYRADGNWGRL